MATTTTIGRMQEFNPDNETISAYLERFNLFVTVNGIEEGKQVSALLLVLGLRHYSLIRGLVSPHKPETKTLAELTDILTKHYDPEPIVIAEQFRFYQRTQKSGESVADFLASLRNSQPLQVWRISLGSIERPARLRAQQRGHTEDLASQRETYLSHRTGDCVGNGSRRQESEGA